MRINRPDRLPAALWVTGLLLTPAGALLAQQPAHPAASPAPAATAPAAAEAKSQASYGIGLFIGQPLHAAGLDKQTLSLPDVLKGMHDALGGKQPDAGQQQSLRSFLESVQNNPASVSPEMKTQNSYVLGLAMGRQLRAQQLTEQSLSMPQLFKGVEDSITGKEPSQEQQVAVQSYIQGIRSQLAERNHAKAKAFLAENSKKPGVVTTASGLQYKILTPGSGQSPKNSDTVSVHYTGKLLDGTEFDGTDQRNNEPTSFQLSDVIKGWQEGLALMKPGAKWEIYIPPDLAYGDNSRPPIPPGSLLVFNVELLKVEPTQPAQPGH
jgi:FKBP-type peptidyl-prolyl cis-trans isomerase